ncbi:MAG: glycosyltransferase family 39 protein [Chloroflexota bacterium]|nr:glycosyltransferase family 39 protein [Chloroflexota bacterium]
MPSRVALLRLIRVILALVWLFVVTFSYYIVHKPFTAENLLALLNALGDVFVAAALFALAAVLGRRVTRAVSFASPLEATVFRIGLGLGIISFTAFALGLLGLLNRILFWLLLIGAAFLLRADGVALWRDLRAIQLPIASRFERWLAAFIVATLALASFVALTPTLAWDAQLYHLYGAKLALAQGRIGVPPDILSLSDPSLVEMLYLAAMALKGDGATALIHLGYAALTLGALLALSQRFFATRVGWMTGAIVLAVPSFLLVSTWPYNDAALAFYAFGALFAVLIAKESLEARWFILAGVFIGFAVGIKYTALLVAVALAAVLWSRDKRVGSGNWVRVFVTGALVGAPWYLRNLVFVGNPIYPFFFGGRYWDAFRAHAYSGFGSGLANAPLRLLLAPWEASILGREGSTSYEATIGPLLLALLPLLLVSVLRRDKSNRIAGGSVLRSIFIFVGVSYAFWLVGAAASRGLTQTRLLFPAFPALALVAAIALNELPVLDLPRFSLARFTELLVSIVLALTLLAQTLDFVALNPLLYLSGFETRDAYLAQRLTPNGYWDALQFLGRLDTPKVFFLWEPRAYYAPDPVMAQPDEILDAFAHLRYLYRDAAGIAKALRVEGYRYILLNHWGLDFQLADKATGLSASDVQILQELTTRYARQVYGTLPLDYTEDAAGNVKVVGVDREAYAVYALDAP